MLRTLHCSWILKKSAKICSILGLVGSKTTKSDKKAKPEEIFKDVFTLLVCDLSLKTISLVSHWDVGDCMTTADPLYPASIHCHTYTGFWSVCWCSVVQMEVLIECWCAGTLLRLSESRRKWGRGGKPFQSDPSSYCVRVYTSICVIFPASFSCPPFSNLIMSEQQISPPRSHLCLQMPQSAFCSSVVPALL